jgi:peptidoglycan/xylan/chitin deacetylase (PgdA/CDA1 family)
MRTAHAEPSTRARRVRARRRVALGAIAVAALLVVALLAGGGSHARSHARSHAAASPWTRDRAHPPAVKRRARKGEPREVRKLVAEGRPIYCAGARGNEVALTFDDGPGTYTKLVLAKLRRHGVRATFFVVARNIPLVPLITRQERALGAVGDHTFTHPLLTRLSKGEAEREMVRAQAALERASGGPVFLFRPPYGGRDATVDAIARAHGMLQILWTVDSADSLGANYSQIERNVIGGLRPGAIVLMHENHGQTVRALLSIFAALRRKHLRAVSVPQLLADDPPSLAQVRAGGLGCGAHVSSLGGS